MKTNNADVGEQVRSDFAELTRNGISLDVAQVIRKRVLAVHRRGGEGDPTSRKRDTRQFGANLCAVAVSFLLQHNWILPAKNLLLELWENLADAQINIRRHVSRAFIAQLLTETAYHARCTNEALRWSLLTHADDLLGRKPSDGAHSKHWLYGIFGVSSAEQERLEDIARQCRRSAQQHGWHTPAGFAEETIRRVCSEQPLGENLLARYPIAEEFPTSRVYLKALLRAMRQASTSDQKGKTLETLASYLFQLLSGSIPKQNVLDMAGASEYDLVVINNGAVFNAVTSRFGQCFLVECKNWSRPVNVATVGYFLHRMRLTHCRFGLILSKNGITGKKGSDAHAEALIRRTFHEDGATCIVVTLADIEQLASGDLSSVTSLLLDRANTLQFGKAR